MRRKTLIIVVAVLVLGSTLAGGLYWYWANSPRYALQQMALALKTKNMDNFFKYLDLKDIFNNFLEASSADLASPQDPGGDEWSRLSQQMGRKFARFLLPKLFDSFEKEIRGLVETYLTNLSNTQILGIVAAATTAAIDQQGDAAQVTLVDPKTKEPFRFQMRRHPESHTWQIVSVNYQDIKKFSKREFQ